MSARGFRRLHVCTLSGLALALFATAPAADAVPLFRTADGSTFCALAERNLAPENPALTCWRHEFGLTATVAHEALPSDRGWRYDTDNEGRRPATGYATVPPGGRFEVRCSKAGARFAEGCPSTEGPVVFGCEVRTGGVTCLNQDGYGFWLSADDRVWIHQPTLARRTYTVDHIRNRYAIRPRRFIQGAHGGYVGLRWSSWTASSARARGVFDYADAYERWRVPIRIRLYRPRRCADGTRIFHPAAPDRRPRARSGADPVRDALPLPRDLSRHRPVGGRATPAGTGASSAARTRR